MPFMDGHSIGIQHPTLRLSAGVKANGLKLDHISDVFPARTVQGKGAGTCKNV
jgi:hypothetical protein